MHCLVSFFCCCRSLSFRFVSFRLLKKKRIFKLNLKKFFAFVFAPCPKRVEIQRKSPRFLPVPRRRARTIDPTNKIDTRQENPFGTCASLSVSFDQRILLVFSFEGKISIELFTSAISRRRNSPTENLSTFSNRTAPFQVRPFSLCSNVTVSSPSDIRVFKDHLFVQYHRIDQATQLLDEGRKALIFRSHQLGTIEFLLSSAIRRFHFRHLSRRRLSFVETKVVVGRTIVQKICSTK